MIFGAFDGKRGGRALRLALLAGTALALTPARAQDATWGAAPGSGNFDDAANWTPAVVPTGTAFFGASTVTALSTNNHTLGGLSFNAGASAYAITNTGFLTITGAGIVNNSGQAQTLANTAFVTFQNASTAGNAAITNSAFVNFQHTSTAGSATINNTAFVTFENASTAGDATITNNGHLRFFGTSTAGNATITNTSTVRFLDTSTAGNAAITTAAGGVTDFSGSTGPLGDNRLSAGSIAGEGNYNLGANELTVGGNGASTKVGGVISGVGGSLVKTGVGTLTLTGANTYGGGSTITGGTLSIAADDNLGDAAGGLALNGGTLLVTGTFTSDRAVTLGAGNGTIEVAAGRALLYGSASTLTGPGGLTKSGAGTLAIQGSSDYAGATLVQAGRLVASSDTAFSANSDYTIATGATLEVTDLWIAPVVGSLSGAGAVEIGSGAMLLTGATNGTATFSGSFSGNGSLGFTGSGTQIYTGTGTLGGGFSICACDTGQFIIRGGSLTLGDIIDISGGTVVVEQGGKLSNSGSGLLVLSNLRVDGVGSEVTTDIFLLQGLASNASLVVSGGARLTVDVGAAVQADFGGSASALVTGAGSLWSIASTFAIGPGSPDPTSVTVADGGELRILTGDLQIDEIGTLSLGNGGTAGLLTIAAGAIANDGAIVADFTDTATLAYDVSGAGTLTKRGGGTLILTGNNSYTGGTTIAGGTLSIAADANLGDLSGVLTLNGGVLQVTGTALTALGRDIAFGANGGGFDIADAGNIFSVSQSFAGPGSLSKLGAGTLLLTGTHSYSGTTTVSGGILRAGVAGAFASTSAFTVASGARLDLAGLNQSIGSLAGAGTVTLGSAVLTTGGDNSSTSFSGTISGTGGLTKTGTGTLTLTGTNSYGGDTTIAGGTLIINGSLASSSVSVGAGTTLGGSGSILGAVTVAFGGTLSAGNSPGTLTVGSLTLNSGSNTVFELGTPGVAGGATNDRIIVNGIGAAGNLTLGGTLTATVGSAGYYRLFDVTGGGTISGSFSTVALMAPTVPGAKGTVYAIPAGAPPQVNLAVLGSGQTMQFWDGGDQAGNGTIDGGTGTWNSSNTNWAVAPGEAGFNAPWLASVGVFQGTAGTVTVSGTQAFDTLQFTTDGYALVGGSLGLGVAGGGTINTAAGVTATIGSTIVDGAGTALTKVGAGTLVLTGANTYSGGTTISAGTLQIGNGGTSGSILGDVVNNGTLAFNRSDALTFGGAISGSGSLVKNGAGTLTLTGVNSYGGGTTLAAGTLSVSSNANLGASAGGLTFAGGTLQATSSFSTARAANLVGAGAVDVLSAQIFTMSGTISGAGSLTKTGAGTLILTGDNSHGGGTTVSAGVLQIGNGGSSGSITGDVVNNAVLAFDRSDALSYGGAISGSGALTKRGSGTLTLTGTNSYAGTTTVTDGKLVVNGSLASSVTLDGGTLGGSGTIGGIVANAGGIVAPGNSIGTLTVAGNVAFVAGSIYQVEVNAAGQGDKIIASGNASITGGAVQVLAASGNYAAATNYTILTAVGGVTGRFAGVSSNLAFLTPSLAYGGNDVVLTMTRNDTGFGPGGGGSGRNYIATTRNQGFIAQAAEALGVGNAVYDTLLSATADEARAGFDLLSGEAHAQGVAVMIDESRLVRETILSHLRGPLLRPAPGEVAASFSADLPGRKGAVAMPAPLPQPRYALWGEAFGGAGNSNADGNAAGLSRRSGGALLGADLMLYDAPGSSLKLGVAGGYSQSRFDLDARLSSGKLESGHAALYAGARFGNLRFDAGAAYSWSESDIRRQVQIRGFGDALRLQRAGAVAQGFAELGYGFAFNGFALEPFAQLALIRVSADAGSERGGAAALRVSSSEQTLGFATLGLRAEAQIGTAPLFARAMLGWRHGFGELTPQAGTAFVARTAPAQVFAARIDRDAVVAEAGLDWRISQATALGLTYSAAIGERSRDHALKGRVEMRF